MSMKLVRLLCCCMSLVSFGETQVKANKARQPLPFDDPIFGISFDPSVVKYEEVPVSFVRQCHDQHYKKDNLRLFAHVRTKQSDFYVVMFASVIYADEVPVGAGDVFGSAIWVKGANCRDVEATWVLSGVPPKNGYNDANVDEKMPGVDVPTPKACNNLSQDELCNYTLRSAHEEAILRDLVKDGIQRAIKAFGGAVPFGRKACSPDIISGNSNSPIVQQELQKFCSNRKGEAR